VSLSEEAYERLKNWKKSDGESFSSVILRAIPKIRTPEEVDEIIASIGHISDEDADKMMEAIEED
jgi:predicted CopG family antitoxin